MSGARGLTDIYLDPALSESVSISRYSQWRDEPDTLANRDKAGLSSIAYSIIKPAARSACSR